MRVQFARTQLPVSAKSQQQQARVDAVVDVIKRRASLKIAAAAKALRAAAHRFTHASTESEQMHEAELVAAALVLADEMKGRG